VNGVIVRNNIGGYGPSSDGINTDSSTDILVENCDVDCNDDNLCIKSGKDADGLRVNRSAENIVYRNCISRRGHGLITLGSETSGGMRNIEVYGLKALGTTTGIRFKSAATRGGVVENVSFHHIEMNEVKYPFHFELNWYPEYSYTSIPEDIPQKDIPDYWHALAKPVTPPEKGIPEFRDISFNKISAKHAGQAFHVNAYADKPMMNLHWNDVEIDSDESGFIHHARDWTLKNVTLFVSGKNKIALKNVTNLREPEYLLVEQSPTGKKPHIERDEGCTQLGI
jgi:polygalacturonase